MTSLQELVAAWLGQDPVAWIKERRSAEPPMIWDLIAVELYDAIGRRRWITPETLRTWVKD